MLWVSGLGGGTGDGENMTYLRAIWTVIFKTKYLIGE